MLDNEIDALIRCAVTDEDVVLATGAAKALTKSQRHAQYRVGLLVLDYLLKHTHLVQDIESTPVSAHYKAKGVLLDLKITCPRRVAYVTSFNGYHYTDKKK